MKLLFCDKCHDVFKLDYSKRECYCGHVKGMYIDSCNAVVNGNGYSLAIGNGSLIHAIQKINKATKEGNSRGDFIDIGRIQYAWVRPHEGSGNPHTKIDKEI